MKKLISAVLLVVMIACVFTSCTYNYSKKDLDRYLDVSGLDLTNLGLKITDGDFYDDETNRNTLTQYKMYSNMVDALVDTTKGDGLKEGVIGANDVMYYNYYGVVTDSDGVEHVIYTAYMDSSKVTGAEFGSAEAGSLTEKIKNSSMVEISDYLYTTDKSTDRQVEEGNTILITYTVVYKFTVEDANGASSLMEQEYTVTNEIRVIDSADGFDAALIGKKVATKFATGSDGDDKLVVQNVTYNHEGIDYSAEATYSNITVSQLMTMGNEIVVTDKTFDEKQEVKDTLGRTVDLNGLEISYHIFPVYFYQIPAISAEIVLDDIKASGLPCMTTEDEELKGILDTINEKRGDISELEDAIEDYDEDDSEKSLEELEEELATRVNELKEADKQFIEKVGADKILEEYRTQVYDLLVEEYEKDINTKIAEKLWDYLLDKLTINSDNLPSTAVKNVYNQLMDNYESDFYTGTTSSSSSETIYSKYGGNFQQYLMDQESADSYKEAKSKVEANAQQIVKELIIIYQVSKHLNVCMTDEQFEEYCKELQNSGSYTYYVYYYGFDNNVRDAHQFDLMINKYIELYGNTVTKER